MYNGVAGFGEHYLQVFKIRNIIFGNQDDSGTVITSYSIHYTKLYDADVRGVFPYPANRDSIKYWQDEDYTYFNDEFGILWRKANEGGLYFDIYGHPLSNKSLEEIQAHPFPNPADDRRFAHIPEYLNTVDASRITSL